MILKIGTIVASRYEIVELIGAGGMSHVYRAIDNKLHRSVTVKVLREEYITDVSFVDRFDREARAIASLNHPNIVNVYDVGNEDDIHYIVMEYIHGKTLKDLISEKAPFSNETMLGVASQIAAALVNAHENGIIHRDIKPQNILCMPNGVVKVADFGIAKSHDSKKLSDDEFSTMGSVHYISPEVACSDPIDPRSDLYSLGIVMFEMMTGELPFDSNNADEITMLHVEAPFPNIRKKNPNVLPVVREIIVRLTNKQPFRRYQSASSLYNDIQRAVMESSEEEYRENTRPAPRTAVFEQKPPQPRDFAQPRVKGVSNKRGSGDKKKDRIIMFGAIGTAAVLIVLLVLLVNWLFDFGGGNNLVNLPNHWGLEVEAVREEMEALGLTLEIYADEYHDTIEIGYITRSEFQDGDNVEPGSTIQVIVSRGPQGAEVVEVPHIVGLHLDAALERLDEISLRFQPDEPQFHDTLGQNFIISQHPPAGQMVAPDTRITVVLSLGQELVMVEMPDFVGMMEHAARVEIVQAGLSIGEVIPVDSLVYSIGIVIGQSVSPGTEVLANSYVDIRVSTGPPEPEEDDEPEPEPEPPADDPDDDEPPTDETPDPDNGDDEPEDNEYPATNGDENGEPDDEDPADTGSTRTIGFMPPTIPDATVRFIVAMRQLDGSLMTVFSDDVGPENFPVSVTVHGVGNVEFIMFVDGTEVGRSFEVFS